MRCVVIFLVSKCTQCRALWETAQVRMLMYCKVYVSHCTDLSLFPPPFFFFFCHSLNCIVRFPLLPCPRPLPFSRPGLIDGHKKTGLGGVAQSVLTHKGIGGGRDVSQFPVCKFDLADHLLPNLIGAFQELAHRKRGCNASHRRRPWKMFRSMRGEE